MLTDDEKFEFDDRYLDVKNHESPSWKEIEKLLKFAEELDVKCDSSYDRIFLLDALQLFSIINIIASLPVVLTILQYVEREDFFIFANYSSPRFIALFVVVGFFLLSGIFSVLSEMYLRKIRRRIKSDLRALDSIVDVIRENFLSITRHLSELQKIQLKIHMSRFNVSMESSIPTRLYLRILSFLFRRLRKL
jgi:hypothetical protein